MKGKAKRHVIGIFKSIGLSAQCFFLLLKNILLVKMLQVKWVSLYDRVVIQDNQVSLLWKTKGCHKIIIKGIGTLKGSANGIRFKLTDITKPIEVYFYGIAKIEHRVIFFIGDKITLLNRFYSSSFLPKTIESIQSKNSLENNFSKSTFEATFKAITFDFDAIVQNEYQLPINTTP